nr:hypothetical protein [Sphingomonas sp. 37zxx]
MNLLVGSQRDNGLMLTALHDNAPFGGMDITSVERAAHKFGDAFDGESLPHGRRPCELRLQEAHYFRHPAEAARSEAFISLLDHRGDRFVTMQELTVTVHTDIFQPDGSAERPIAVHHTRNHPVLGLLAIFLPLVL